MYQFHGWITLVPSIDTDDYDMSDEIEIAQKVKEFIKKITNDWGNSLLKLHTVNAHFYVIIAGCTNHRREEIDDVFELFKYVGKIASGSYGLLYIRDNEDQNGFDNEFQVFALRKGLLTQHKDKILSPCIPIIDKA